MNTSVYLGSQMGSTTNRSRFGASSRRKFMQSQMVPTVRDLKEQSVGMQPILKVGQKVHNGQCEVSSILQRRTTFASQRLVVLMDAKIYFTEI
jgi:hypothetical protein